MAPAETWESGEPAPTTALSISLSPQGHVHVHVDVPVKSDVTSSLVQIAKHFERGDGYGVFRLGATEPETPLPGALGFWRDVGRAFVVRLCATEDLETLRQKIEVEVPPDELAAIAAASPPMTGGEYLTPTVLADLCARMAAAVRDELATWDGTVEAFLRQASPAWNLVGRVCFHLAENKNDPEAPFAFLATYTTGCPRGPRPSTSPSLRLCASTPAHATRQRCWPCSSQYSAPRGRAPSRKIWSMAAPCSRRSRGHPRKRIGS